MLQKVFSACEMAVAVDDIEGRSSVSTVSSHKEICTRTSWVDARTALAHITKVLYIPATVITTTLALLLHTRLLRQSTRIEVKFYVIHPYMFGSYHTPEQAVTDLPHERCLFCILYVQWLSEVVLVFRERDAFACSRETKPLGSWCAARCRPPTVLAAELHRPRGYSLLL